MRYDVTLLSTSILQHILLISSPGRFSAVYRRQGRKFNGRLMSATHDRESLAAKYMHGVQEHLETGINASIASRGFKACFFGLHLSAPPLSHLSLFALDAFKIQIRVLGFLFHLISCLYISRPTHPTS
jgi:hypothetical protein